MYTQIRRYICVYIRRPTNVEVTYKIVAHAHTCTSDMNKTWCRYISIWLYTLHTNIYMHIYNHTYKNIIYTAILGFRLNQRAFPRRWAVSFKKSAMDIWEGLHFPLACARVFVRVCICVCVCVCVFARIGASITFTSSQAWSDEWRCFIHTLVPHDLHLNVLTNVSVWLHLWTGHTGFTTFPFASNCVSVFRWHSLFCICVSNISLAVCVCVYSILFKQRGHTNTCLPLSWASICTHIWSFGLKCSKQYVLSHNPHTKGKKSCCLQYW